MAGRMLPLFVVLALAGSPVASQACQIACASPAEHAGMSHSAPHQATHESGHSCHEAVTAGAPETMPDPYACGNHREGQPPATLAGATANSTAASVLALVSASPVAADRLDAQTLRSTLLSRCATDRASTRSLFPLRI